MMTLDIGDKPIHDLESKIQTLAEHGLTPQQAAEQLRLGYDPERDATICPYPAACDDAGDEIFYEPATDRDDMADHYMLPWHPSETGMSCTVAAECSTYTKGWTWEIDPDEPRDPLITVEDVKWDVEWHLTTYDPDEPRCDGSDTGAHRWDQADVRGLQGAAVQTVDRCSRCTMVRTMVHNAEDGSTGMYYDSIAYSESGTLTEDEDAQREAYYLAQDEYDRKRLEMDA